MSRIRTIKPEMAKHEALYDLELATQLPIRFAWAMLPTACDREGRFQWRPRTIKTDLLPHDPIDFSRVLDAWLTRGFVVKYRVGNEWFGWVPTFRKHQVINPRETASVLPSIEQAEEIQDYRNQQLADASATRESQNDDASATRHGNARGEGKGREGERKEFPDANASGVPGEPGPPVCPHAEIIALYHELLPSLARVRDWTPARQALLRKRWAEKPKRQSLDFWRKLFEYIAGCDFLMGRAPPRPGQRPFECDLEWIVRPSNFVKILEGKYKNAEAAA